MGRKLRVSLPNVPVHIFKKSINQENIFQDIEDYNYFYNSMFEIAQKFEIKIYAYLILKDSFEMVISSILEENISKFMQLLGRDYVLYYNKKYNRTGTIWEGRYKSSLIEKETFLQKVVSYIDYLAIKNSVCNTICASTKEVLNIDLDDEEILFIENSLNSGTTTGSEEFTQIIQNTTGISLFAKRRGRPKSDYIKGDKLYKKLELLSRDKHKDIKIGQLDNLLFAKDIPTFPVLANELEFVANSFPVVFSADENPSIFAISSLGNENLAMNRDGKWLNEYVPAVYRKYPFTYVSNKDNPEERAVAIDVEASHVNRTFGQELFDEEFNQTNYLKDVIQFLTSYEQEVMRTKMIAKIISDSGILEDREISIGEGEAKQILVKGFKVVDIQKLYALDDSTLASWVRNGIISFINVHIKSLDNMQTLMNLLFQRNK